MKSKTNRARIPYRARAKAFRWTRAPAKWDTPAEPETCSGNRHIWVSKTEPPAPDERCLYGRHVYGGGRP